MTLNRGGSAVSLGLAGLALVLLPIPCVAQAWVPPRGEGSVSLSAQQLNVKKHKAGTVSTDAGHINTGVLLLITYVPDLSLFILRLGK